MNIPERNQMRFVLTDSFKRECPITPKQLSAQKKAFKAAGGKVQYIAPGASAYGPEGSIAPRSFKISTQEERNARQQAKRT